MSNELKVDLAGVDPMQVWREACEAGNEAFYMASEQPGDPEGIKQCQIADDASATVIATALQSLAAQLAEARAENARLRETVDAVWKEATTMRNASKLVGPYPTEPSKHRVWVRSMYHAGKKLHELMKPIRALKENPNAG